MQDDSKAAVWIIDDFPLMDWINYETGSFFFSAFQLAEVVTWKQELRSGFTLGVPLIQINACMAPKSDIRRIVERRGEWGVREWDGTGGTWAALSSFTCRLRSDIKNETRPSPQRTERRFCPVYFSAMMSSAHSVRPPSRLWSGDPPQNLLPFPHLQIGVLSPPWHPGFRIHAPVSGCHAICSGGGGGLLGYG